ncbi:MAG: glycosyltransferase family 2 protein [Chitinophagales bacterium]|jgi:glycosyltransferase involved in cell wall biosynthesis|nr:glycosyltransferase family 2 protein [Chitinophagales bacterium]
MKDLLVVIPVYNEEEIIQTVIKDWITVLNDLKIDFQILVLNDGSIDNTLAKLQEVKLVYPQIEIIDKSNSGHGPTILEGYRWNTSAKFVFQVDSDNEMKANHFKSFWELRNDFDFIVARRVNRASPIIRKIMTMISALVVHTFYGIGVKDVNSPFRLMNAEKYKEIYNKIPSDTFAPNLIISGMSAKNRLRIKNIDVPFEIRQTGLPSLGSNIGKLLKISYLSFRQTIAYRFQ